MKKYQCHKVVSAARINSCGFEADGSGWVQYTDTDGEEVQFDASIGFVRPGTMCDPGDYLVRYQPDGYLSWSPKAVFEAGYAELPPATPGVGGPVLTQVDDVTVTVTAPPGKRARVSTIRFNGNSITQTVTGGQSQQFTIGEYETIKIEDGQPHSTVALQAK